MQSWGIPTSFKDSITRGRAEPQNRMNSAHPKEEQWGKILVISRLFWPWVAHRGFVTGDNQVQSCPSGRNERKEKGSKRQQKCVHGDALCFMVLGPSQLQRLAVGGWRLVVGSGWQLAAVGSGWRLAVGGWWSLEAVLRGCP